MVNSSVLNSDAVLDFIDYRDRSQLYFENGLNFADTRLEKASEFFWGAVAQAVKALAAINQTKLRGHDEIRDFIIEFAKEKKEPTIKNLFWDMNALHINFYEGKISEYEFPRYVQYTEQLLTLLKKYYISDEKVKKYFKK